MNIDKDIEIIKEFKEKGFASLMIKYNKNRIQTNTMVEMAIENVLKELDTYKKIVAEIEKYIESVKYAKVKIVTKPKFDYKDEIIWELDDEKSGVYIEIEQDKIEKILKLKEVDKDVK